MNELKVLVVEDDTPIRNLIITTLKSNGYAFCTAENGTQAILEASTHQPDVVFLDMGLPDMDGLNVIRNIRTWSDIPIIVISARSEDQDKIEALDMGADDYLTKPFSVEELLARLRVAARRIRNSGQRSQSAVFTNGDLWIDFAAGSVRMAGKELQLTRIEYRILVLLAQNVGRVLTHTYITGEIWGNSWDNTVASLRVFMASLRKKLEEDPSNPRYIQTHIGIGYRMNRL